MRCLYCMLGMLLSIASHAQQQGDTLYRSGVSEYGSVNTVYIERDNLSDWYLQVSDLTLCLSDAQGYQYSMKFLSDSGQILTKKKIRGIPLVWTNLVYYNDSFYLYKPCDFLWTDRISISDSALIHFTGEGPGANKIISYKKVNSRHFEFELFGDYKGRYLLSIHIIDRKKGIAIFCERFNKDDTPYCRPMVNIAKMRKLPIVVNHCIGNKAMEYDFPEVDFSKFISKKYRH